MTFEGQIKCVIAVVSVPLNMKKHDGMGGIGFDFEDRRGLWVKNGEPSPLAAAYFSAALWVLIFSS